MICISIYGFIYCSMEQTSFNRERKVFHDNHRCGWLVFFRGCCSGLDLNYSIYCVTLRIICARFKRIEWTLTLQKCTHSHSSYPNGWLGILGPARTRDGHYEERIKINSEIKRVLVFVRYFVSSLICNASHANSDECTWNYIRDCRSFSAFPTQIRIMGSMHSRTRACL